MPHIIATPIVIAVYGESPHLKACKESIEKYTENYRLIVQNTLTPKRRTLGDVWNEALYGIHKNRDQFAIVLNDDTKATPDWIRTLLRPLYQNPKVAVSIPSLTACACAEQKTPFLSIRRKNHLEYTDEDITQAAQRLRNNYGGKEQFMNSHVSGVCMAIRLSAFVHVGGFCEEFKWAYGEDWEFFDRLIFNGWKIVHCKDAFIWHYGAGTGNKVKDINRNFTNDLYRKKLLLLQTKGYKQGAV